MIKRSNGKISFQKICGKKIFNEEYIKSARNPEPHLISELFDVIANEEDLDEEDPRLFLIQEFLDYLDIEVVEKKNFIELKFIKMEEDFDESIFDKDELTTIHKIVSLYKDSSPRNIANVCFKIDEVRATQKGELIISYSLKHNLKNQQKRSLIAFYSANFS